MKWKGTGADAGLKTFGRVDAAFCTAPRWIAGLSDGVGLVDADESDSR
jgi:hypothetical protein